MVFPGFFYKSQDENSEKIEKLSFLRIICNPHQYNHVVIGSKN